MTEFTSEPLEFQSYHLERVTVCLLLQGIGCFPVLELFPSRQMKPRQVLQYSYWKQPRLSGNAVLGLGGGR